MAGVRKHKGRSVTMRRAAVGHRMEPKELEGPGLALIPVGCLPMSSL